MPLRRRPDGSVISGLHSLRRIMPFIMPSRTESFVLFEQTVPTAPIAAYLQQVNAGRPAEARVTLFHVVLHGIGRVLHEFPRLNRFVMGSRLYARDGIWLSFSAKKQLTLDASLFTAKVRFEPGESLVAMVDRIHASLREGRAEAPTAIEKEASLFLKIPTGVLKVGTRWLRRLDAWNLLPASFIAGDPMYASAFVANLGSVGLDAAFHHNYEYGTIPIFVTVGRIHRAPVVRDDDTVGVQEVIALRYTYDERVEDGFYAARALERLRAHLLDPARLAP